MANSFSRTCRSLAGDSSHNALLVWSMASVVLGAWLAWFLFVKVTVYEVSQSARLEVEKAAHPVASLIAGKVIWNSLRLGQQVSAGEILLKLDDETENLRLQEEEARLDAIPPQTEAIRRQIADQEQAAQRGRAAAASAIEQARWRHREALSTAQFAEEHYRRVRQLGVDRRIAEIEVLRARTETDKSRSAADALAAEISRSISDAAEKEHSHLAALEALRRELAALNGQRELSGATIARLRQDIERHLIRAPVAGKVGSVAPLDIGAFVGTGGVVGSIIPSGNLRVVAEFPPARVLGRVHPGQSARMRLDGFPWAQYGSIPVKVDRVASEIRDNRIRVEFLPDSQDHAGLLLQHGLPGAVEIDIEQTTPATLALRAAGRMRARAVPPGSRIASAGP